MGKYLTISVPAKNAIRRKPIIYLAPLSALLVIGLCACGSSNTATKNATSLHKASLGSLTIDVGNYNTSFALVGIAKNAGCFSEQGFQSVNIAESTNQSAITDALNEGELDLVQTTSTNLVTAIAGGATNLVALGSLYDGGLQIMVASNKLAASLPEKATIAQRVQALKGKSIAVTSIGGGNYQFAVAALEAEGLNPEKDATIVPTGSQANEYAALAAGRVDAMVQSQPLVAQAVAQHIGQVLFTVPELPIVQTKSAVLVANRNAVEKNPTFYVSIMKAMFCADKVVLDSPVTARNDARQYSGGSTVSASVWSSAWASEAKPGTGPVWLAAKDNMLLTTQDVKNIIASAGSSGKNVKPSEVYDGTPRKTALSA
jgi:NitT/TauT family transport system substrate-binding protein